VTAAIDRHATIEERLEAVFSVRSVQRLYQESLQAEPWNTEAEEASTLGTVTRQRLVLCCAIAL
jgi:hypothetical protein